jgi:uracil-DNA glycosylase
MEQLALFGELSSTPITEKNRIFVELISESWFRKIGSVFTTLAFSQLAKKVVAARSKNIVYPAEEEVFRAYLETPFEEVKVIILGQDPYPDENAEGLSFSCKKQMSQTLRVMHQELLNEYGFGTFRNLPTNPSLDYWAKQGVFLLNSALTVDTGHSNSHENFGWECVILPTIAELIKDQSPKVFMLWGANAKKLFKLADVNWECTKVHSIIEAAHPIIEERKKNNPALNPYQFYGLHVFRRCNEFLVNNGKEPIQW